MDISEIFKGQAERIALAGQIVEIEGLVGCYPSISRMSEKELRLVLARYANHGLPEEPHWTAGNRPHYADDEWNFQLDEFPADYIEYLSANGDDEAWVRGQLLEQDLWPSTVPRTVIDLEVYGPVSQNGVQVGSIVMGTVEGGGLLIYEGGLAASDGDDSHGVVEKWNWCVENCQDDWWTAADYQEQSENHVLAVSFVNRADRDEYLRTFPNRVW